MLERVHVLTIITLTLACLSACGPSSAVPTASCSSSNGVSEASCTPAGEASGCKTSSFTPGSGGQSSGCSFTDCDEPPSCSPIELERDAGTKDAGVDPKCKTADADGDGMFSSTPPCANPGMVKVNGATNYTCPCAGACPCGYECGSIKLSVGGTLSSVCAPPSH
ncbi:MAG TPA: hypothetical protein VJV78_37520 [Polyangiales bacterium]|nr:hypothetical protein [Polyangiales bacterium]